MICGPAVSNIAVQYRKKIREFSIDPVPLIVYAIKILQVYAILPKGYAY
jgi:hypothetical protein